jgi:hypothetical protein
VAVPRIVDDALFDRVQRRIQENRHFDLPRLSKNPGHAIRKVLLS